VGRSTCGSSAPVLRLPAPHAVGLALGTMTHCIPTSTPGTAKRQQRMCAAPTCPDAVRGSLACISTTQGIPPAAQSTTHTAMAHLCCAYPPRRGHPGVWDHDARHLCRNGSRHAGRRVLKHQAVTGLHTRKQRCGSCQKDVWRRLCIHHLQHSRRYVSCPCPMC
jgi:hypothetical protein